MQGCYLSMEVFANRLRVLQNMYAACLGSGFGSTSSRGVGVLAQRVIVREAQGDESGAESG